MASNNYAFLSNGILSIYTYENEGVFGAIESVAIGNTGYDFNVSINTTSLTIQNTTTVFTLKSPNTFQINAGSYYLNANGSWVIVTGGSGGGITQIETSNGIDGGTITNTGMLYIKANTGVSVNSSGLFVNVAYINTISANSASYLGGNTAASLKGYADNAYSNAISTSSTDASTKAGTAYTNAVSTAAADATSKAAAAYTNALTIAAGLYVNSSQLSSNLSNYQTTAGLAANVAELDSATVGGNSASTLRAYSDTKADAAYTNAVSIAASDATSKASAAYTNALSIAAGLYVNSSQLSSNLANYQTTAGLAANVATLTANNSTNLGGEAAAKFVQNTDSRVLSGNLNFTGTNTYYTSGLFVGSNLSINTSILFIGNSTVNTVINSSALAVNSIIANGSLGTLTQILASNGTGLYWADAPTGGASTIVSQQFTANGTANSFVISGGYLANQVQVFLNGVKQLPVTDVTITNGTAVGFVVTPANAAIVDIYGYQTSITYTANSVVVGNVNIGLNSITVGNSTVNTVVSNGNLSINGSNVSPVQSFRNKIINGNFDIWQRNTANTAQGYLADRFYIGNTGSTFSASRQTFTLGQTDVPGEPTYWHRVVVTTSAAAGNYCRVYQPIEYVKTLAGKTATLSFWAKADASKNIATEFVQNFGTGGSPSSEVTSTGVTTHALTTTWTKYTATVSIPSISGKTLGSNVNDYLALYFWFDAGSTFNSRTNTLGQQSGTFDIAMVQFEEGSVATPFEIRPMAIELHLCQRYCQRYGDSTAAAFAAYNTTGSAAYYTTAIPEMRGTPTFTKFGTWNVSNCGQPSFAGTKNVMTATAVITSTGTCLFWAGTNLYVLLSAEL